MLNTLFFITFRWLDLVDILLVAVIMFQLYKLVKGTVAIRIFLGILALYLFWKIVEALQMELLSEILGQFIGVGVLALIIVFQQEIRRFLLIIGNNSFFSKGKNKKLLNLLNVNSKTDTLLLKPILSAVRNLSITKTGALIVIDLKSELKFYSTSGEKINSILSTAILESIFFKNSPLHDGGVIIENNKIIAARCIFPISENQNFPDHFGLRHRAASGITETSQSIAIIVSEENGRISTAKFGEINYNISINDLEKILDAEFV